tara:strand:+ start:6794 stop:7576 length:783 start_codon:yes stop_codon:yes gene_type:complete
MEWHTLAENLPTGHKTRSNCTECGDGKTLIINHNATSYSCHCFRCDFNDFVGKGKQSLAELSRIDELNKAAKTIQLPLELPHDFTTEIPLSGRLWLYGGGIAESTYKEHGLGYSKSLDRVVLPVWDANRNLEWFQCRSLHKGQKPKYIQPARSRDRVMFRVGFDRETVQRVVIVEDILSAIRVGKHVPTASLLGTKITTGQATELSRFSRVTTWLDPDKAGREGAYNIRKTLGLITEVDNIVTLKDPKELSDQQIIEELK